jgi:hypothetical protein
MFGNLIEQLVSSGLIKKVNSTPAPTNNDLNNSPRNVDINQPRAVPFSGQSGTGSAADINKPRTAQFSGADVNSNTYGKTNDIQDFFKDIMLKEGGEVSKGKKEIKKKFGHEGAIDPKKAQVTKLLKSGGEVLAKGNKLAKHRPTKLY